MNKILIDVFIPSIEEQYSIFIPVNKKVGTIKKYVLESVSELLEDEMFKDIHFNMYDNETGNILDNNMYVKDSGIKNGSKIILI